MTLIIRANGGAQAGHGVVLPDGRAHIFAQFGSATFVPGAQTHLSRHFVLHPLRMLVEDDYLRRSGVDDAFRRTTISENALVITPFHEIANRLREYARGANRHGSCGIGVGETVRDSTENDAVTSIRAGNLRDDDLSDRLYDLRWRKKEQLHAEGVLQACWNVHDAQADIEALLAADAVTDYLDALVPFLERARIVDDGFLTDAFARSTEALLLTDLLYGDQGKGTTVDFFARNLADRNAIVFEHAQGVVLDEWRGFHPFTTWSTCTLDNPERLLAEHRFRGTVRRLGIIRAYATRHGHGPFVTEDAGLTARLPDPPSAAAKWQGTFRVGWFDAVAVRYAIACVGKLDGLVVTCLDRLADEPEWRICTEYDTGRDIPLGPHKDLAFQEGLTRRMFEAGPTYQTSTSAATQPQRVAEHLLAIERELGLPVVLASHGPTHEDKAVLA